MRIAIPTNDKITVFKRSGRAKGFLIMELSDDGVKEIDYVINNHQHGHHHHHSEGGHNGHGHSHEELVEKLNGCDYIIVNMIGSHFGRDVEQAGIKVFITGRENIDGALKEFRQKVM